MDSKLREDDQINLWFHLMSKNGVTNSDMSVRQMQ